MDSTNLVIVGGGIVGCAIAQELSESFEDVFLLEQSPKLGMAASSRNSGVIHSGIYYPQNSLKARFCLEGNRLTKEYCAARQVPLQNCGKIVVASHESEVPALERLAANGRANGVEGLRFIGPREIKQREPHITAITALEVPSTSIVAVEELLKSYARVAVERGANILTDARVVSLEARSGSVSVTVEIGDPADGGRLERETIETRCLVNAAGLYSDEIAALLGNSTYRIYPVRGEYAEIVRAKANLVNALVYPMPHTDQLGLGVHLTRTLWDTVLVGPTARYVDDKSDYEKDRLPLSDFLDSARLLLPELEIEDLRLAYSGIRAKLVAPDEHRVADFVITRDPAVPEAIHLIGIESPGLTSALAIARHVKTLVAETLA